MSVALSNEPLPLDQILKLGRRDLEAMEPEALAVMMAEWKDMFIGAGLAWRDFDDLTAGFNKLQRSRLKKDPKSFYVHFLDALLQSARATQRATTAVAQNESFVQPQEYVEEAPIWVRMEREAADILDSAKLRSADAYHEWQTRRQPVDGKQRPVRIHDDDQKKVDEIDAERLSKNGDEREFQERTDLYEVTFARALRDFHVLGDELDVEVEPPTTYDDYFRHVDFMARFQIPDESGTDKEIVLGIDFSISRNEADQARKITRNLDQPTRSLKYGTERLSKGQVFIPAVLTLDQVRSERLSTYFGVQDVPVQNRGIDRTLRAEFEKELDRYHDRDIMQYEVLKELTTQIRIQRELIRPEVYDAETVQRYDLVIAHLNQLLEQRKNLRAPVGEEIDRGGVGDVYRVGDERFIRSARKIATNDVERLRAA